VLFPRRLAEERGSLGVLMMGILTLLTAVRGGRLATGSGKSVVISDEVFGKLFLINFAVGVVTAAPSSTGH
jgi:hypothetical protein